MRGIRALSLSSLLLVGCVSGSSGDPDDVGQRYDAVRVSVRDTGAGLEVTGAFFTLEAIPEVQAPPERSIGTVRVQDDSGRVLASVEVARPEPISVIAEDGSGGDAVVPDTTSVLVPWPVGAHSVHSGTAGGSGGGGAGGGSGGGSGGGGAGTEGVIPRPPSELSPPSMAPSPAPGEAPTPSGHIGPDTLPAVRAVHETGPASERFDFVVVGDGYTDHTTFFADVGRFKDALLAMEPYRTFTDRINIWAVPTATSASSSALQCKHDCQGIDRLICCDEGAAIAAARSAVPGSESVLVLVSSTKYGGSGGNIAVGYSGPQMATVMLHELGHTLGLDDEYVYEGGDASVYAGAKAGVNCAGESPPHWAHWMDVPDVGEYGGCRFNTFTRPTENGCLMKDVANSGYCPVCREHVALRIYEALGGLIESATPETDDGDPAEVSIGDAPTRFELTTQAVGEPTYEWTLAFEDTGESGPTLELDACAVSQPSLLDAKVTDHTEFVRRDPHGYTTDKVRWSLAPGPDAETDGCLPMCIGDACEIGTPCCDASLVCYPTSRAADAAAQCCGIADVHCGADSDCCGEMACTDGACACQAVGQPCVDHRECCGAAFCSEGTCAFQ